MEPQAQQPSVRAQADNGPQSPAGRDKPVAGRRGQYQRREARRAERESPGLPWTDIPASRSRDGSNCRAGPSPMGCAKTLTCAIVARLRIGETCCAVGQPGPIFGQF